MSATSPSRGLSIHRRYGCRHSGACCTAGWEIPVERALDIELRTASAAGHLTWSTGTPLLVDRPGLPGEYASVLARREGGACVLHDAPTNRCRAHTQLGSTRKPVACRQFPWILVHDPRGTSMSLSHFCPTAAALLFDDEPLRTVDLAGHSSLDPGEGLDVRGSLPPALDSGRLVDWDTLTAWEELVLDVFDGADSPGHALAALRDACTHLQAWTSRAGRMDDWLRRFDTRSATRPGVRSASCDWHDLVCAAIPASLRPPAPRVPDEARWAGLVEPDWSPFVRPVCRYLAARAFACWPLHVGQGLLTEIRYLEAALGLVEEEATREVHRRGVSLDASILKEAIRRSDLLLVHLADPHALAAALDLPVVP